MIAKNILNLLTYICVVGLSINLSNGQSDKFSFDRLKKKKIVFKDISLGENILIYNDKISMIEQDSIHSPKLSSIKLSNEQEIYHECYDYITNKEEYLRYYNQKINIDSLLRKNSNNYKFYQNNKVLFVGNVSLFNFKGNKFIILSARDRGFFRDIERNYWIILQVKREKIINSYSFIDGYLLDQDCFGDFNNDGYLDYMDWGIKKSKIEMYSLKQNKIVKDKYHFIEVKPSKNQIELMKEDDTKVLYEIIDKKKTKWFYKL